MLRELFFLYSCRLINYVHRLLVFLFTFFQLLKKQKFIVAFKICLSFYFVPLRDKNTSASFSLLTCLNARQGDRGRLFSFGNTT